LSIPPIWPHVTTVGAPTARERGVWASLLRVFQFHRVLVCDGPLFIAKHVDKIAGVRRAERIPRDACFDERVRRVD